jgi:N-acetylglucosaminyldiphosphoundecaprenol N-acetyl-beta-D-mannosaminyltransferase
MIAVAPTFSARANLAMNPTVQANQSPSPSVAPIWVWGVPLIPLTLPQTLDKIAELIAARTPTFFITANVHYAMVTHENPDVAALNNRAAFLLADGAPLVWASRLTGTPLPERVAGSDLIFRLSEQAAAKGHRMFFLGGAEGVAQAAADRLTTMYPGLQIVGIECPPFRPATPEEEVALLARIEAAQPDILFVAFGQPKGERWIIRHLDHWSVPVSVQVGASLDFAAGRVSRAPRWMQKIGLEWAYRLSLEPRRLAGRYAKNALFIAKMLTRDLFCGGRQKPPPPAAR